MTKHSSGISSAYPGQETTEEVVSSNSYRVESVQNDQSHDAQPSSQPDNPIQSNHESNSKLNATTSEVIIIPKKFIIEIDHGHIRVRTNE